jgi:mitochondrial fission protein ELM1
LTLPAASGIDNTEGAVLSASAEPRAVWLLTTERAGDRAQILALAQVLAWPFQEKRLVFNKHYKLPNVVLGASPRSLDTRASSLLDPPWPDLVIASGRRCTPIARWIRNRSGDRVRLVHIGRPWAPLKHFDLIVTTPQYCLPRRSNVLHNTLTLNRADPAQLAAAADAWRSELERLPKPHVALVVGGSARPYHLDAATAGELGQQASALAEAAGGSLLVTTSRRTATGAVDALFAAISCPTYRHRWTEGAANPYLAFLALADSFVVTGDSASMLSEACATGKPVFVFPLPERLDRKMRNARQLRALAARCRKGIGAGRDRDGWLARAYDSLVDLGLIKSTRDMAQFHLNLIDGGLAARLGEAFVAKAERSDDDLARAAARVRALFS